MTVGPKIVGMRDAPVGSPTYAWIRPAPIEATPATKTIQPSHRGYTPLSATARPNRMNVAAAKTKLKRLASAKLMVSLTWTRPSAVAFPSGAALAHSWASCLAATPVEDHQHQADGGAGDRREQTEPGEGTRQTSKAEVGNCFAKFATEISR